MTNKALLEDAIQKSGLKKKHIAEQIGLSRVGFNNCLNNRAEFKASHIHALCQLLDIKPEQREAIFFASFGV